MTKVLKAAGSGLEHIVKANVYLKNMERDFGPMNEIYIQVHSSPVPYSTRTADDSAG